ncbi:S8 family serine peptidase [Halomonas sp. PAMB 3232]|uniref:S8 family serine peptidase n=1 Tax=Halomonas sp. PAMB 3232 TaxID=3075221 RepID=UPI002898492D|nr:S8 family serine peptidase [Halomonas sp. PAMB 3232]WNL37437.1 S8 family serine peptidase [Halomonas sp. PAMB 3232]
MANDSHPNSHTPSAAPLRSVACGSHQLLMAAVERDSGCLETGRYLISFRDGMLDEGIEALKACQFRVADARDFDGQAVNLEEAGDAEAMIFPELGVVLIGGDALESRGMSIHDDAFKCPAIEIIEPEYFAFAENSEYLRGFLSAANAIARDLGGDRSECDEDAPINNDITWGLARCKVAQSRFTGAGIKVAVLDSGMDLNHPDFTGRAVESRSFVGEPVQDMNGHGTHCIGTATGPRNAAGKTPGYGVAFEAAIFAGKVLTNAGGSTGGSVLAGMNWAVANRCEVISMSLGSQSPVQTAYTRAGAAALEKGCLVIAASGNDNAPTGAPANSPTIFSVGSLDPNLARSNFSNVGKVEIAAPGRDVFSAWPRPVNYKSISGTSMATPHVAGCAALWAQSDALLRGASLWQRLIASAQSLPLSEEQVGAGLVQAP